jgi:hypothetical protein
MALYSTRTYDWQDLADDSVTWGDWLEWTGNGTTINGSTGFDDLVHTTAANDLGSVTTFYPETAVDALGTVTVKYLVSDDDVSYTEYSPVVLTGRYVKVKVTIANATTTAELYRIESNYFTDPASETFKDLSISSSGTTLPIARTFGSLAGITASTSANIQAVLTDTTPTAPVVTCYDMDTWGKIAVNTTATITLTGYPSIAADSNGNVGPA